MDEPNVSFNNDHPYVGEYSEYEINSNNECDNDVGNYDEGENEEEDYNCIIRNTDNQAKSNLQINEPEVNNQFQSYLYGVVKEIRATMVHIQIYW